MVHPVPLLLEQNLLAHVKKVVFMGRMPLLSKYLKKQESSTDPNPWPDLILSSSATGLLMEGACILSVRPKLFTLSLASFHRIFPNPSISSIVGWLRD